MTPREIIARAWHITTTEPKLRHWAFTSSLLETLLSLKLLLTQAYFAWAYFYGHHEAGFFDIEIAIWNFFPQWAAITILLSFVLLVLVEFFFPHLCLGAIIGLAAKRAQGQPVRGGLVLGLYNFFPIFALHEFLVLSTFPTAITAISLILRYIDAPLKGFSVFVVICLFLVGNFLKFLFAFAEEAVVIQKMSVFDAVGRSFKLLISNLQKIMFLYLLMIVISLRILINAVMIIIIPAIVLGFGFLLTYVVSHMISIIIASILGLVLTVVASYFLGYILAFKQTVWTITYLEFMKEKDLDEIQ